MQIYCILIISNYYKEMLYLQYFLFKIGMMNMKKFLLIILILIISLTSPTEVYAQGFTDISKDLAEPAGILSSYGIIQGYPDGTFKPDKFVTRAEMAKIVTVTAGLSEYSRDMASAYNDMKGHWAESYVDLAGALNLVKGITPNSYGPDNLIRFEEAYTMIIRLLGYSDESLKGLWPTNYYNKASELKLFKNIDSTHEYATRRDVTLMLYNALSCNTVKIKDNNTVYSTGKPLLSLLGKMSTKEITMSDLNNESFDFTNYLFNKWDVYYDNKGNAVYAANPRHTEFTGKVTSLMANRVIFVTDDYGNVNAFKLPEISIVINGEKGTFNSLKDSSIRVVYEDDSLNGEVIGITAYKETDAIVVERNQLYKTGSKQFAGKNLPVKSNGEVNYNKLHIYGDATKLEDIQQNDLIYFYGAKESNKASAITMHVVRKQTEGMVTDVQKLDNHTYYTVNNISYKTSDSFMFTEEVSVNDNVNLILDRDNNIIKINILSYGKTPSTYGIVVNTDNSGSNVSAKIFDEYGKIKDYTLADNSSVVNITGDGKDLSKKTYLKNNDIVKFDPPQSGALKIINHISSTTYIANSYNANTYTLSNGYWLSSKTFIVYESNSKYQLLKPNQLGSYLEGKAVVGENYHIDALYLSKGIKSESPTIVAPKAPQSYSGAIYGIIKGVTKIDTTTNHVQFFNNSNVFSVSSSSDAGKRIPSVLNTYVKATIANGVITNIEKVTAETDKVKITQIFASQFLIDNITYMEYSPELTVFVCTTDNAGNVDSFKSGSKSDIKSGSIVQLYDLYGGFDGIIDVVLVFN